ncbi:hypothetical protein KZO83_07580 [Chromohalobacter sp. TMW 2.2308]|uniref:hypothetical protein n=1 Tax=Chromohalobacter TaxID=42054 RepID=UPI001FFD9EAB|nr:MULTISPECIES: hypothetical protein [Chromohalobacter]MCK2042548.1 hypothetical protein [Chromohalobacter moromii]MCT8514932.1 hypothetical protein [Chromohalobacter sp. TMW 2.2271]
MKTGVLLIAAMVCSFASSVYAATYNISEQRINGDWFSAKLSLGNVVYYRAGNVLKDGSSLFLDYYPGDCGNPHLQIMTSGPESMSEDVDLYLDSFVRVDHKDVIKSSSHVTASRGDTNVFTSFDSDNPRKILEALKEGKNVRFKVVTDEPFFFTFGLNGSAASMTLASSRCKRQSDDPESYFPDTSTN